MPYKLVHCSQCGTGFGGDNFPQRIAKLRRHYRDKHPRKWAAAIRRGVAKRKKK